MSAGPRGPTAGPMIPLDVLRQFFEAALDQPAPTAALRAAIAACEELYRGLVVVHAARGTLLERMVDLTAGGRAHVMQERRDLGWDP